ncbi:cytochrome c551 [Priestia taiwanensis]|uniref:Cytochrome c-551 n=1 Tax=Priestia taiwanensis TaxID=1347902 RepID=A0A917AX79_9BACI|nr:cytochrome c [Priestia taiwanensis]MBM7364398.1 cytochrome c551 [Priestia taiwanensis]GGE81704.1 cytochrome c-551 [Priestia taiwanensis]
MKKKVVALLLGVSLVVGACGKEDTKKPDGASSTTPTASGEQLFKRSCASCHGGNLEGNAGPKLSEIGNKYSAEEIEKIILKGQGNMRGGFLQGADATEVAKWLAEKK